MYPILFQYKGLTISTYGLMLMLAFLVCNYLLKNYLKSIDVKPEIGDDIIFYAAIGGILGAKIYYIIENIPSGEGYQNLLGLMLIFKGLFNLSFEMISEGITQFGSGLVFLGGLIGGMLSVTYYIKKNNLDWFVVADWVAPFLALGHSIGRIGCFLVGDCYGRPCHLPWSVTFEKGLPATTYENFQLYYPSTFEVLVKPFYKSLDLIYVHPTQIYETILYALIFIYLSYMRKHIKFNGMLIVEYLFLAGMSRFFIEFYRLNPKYLFNLSGAQFISLIMIFISTLIFYYKIKSSRA